MHSPEKVLPGVCPVGNYCEITAFPDGPPCGSTISHMTVLLPAEQICLKALDGRAAMVDKDLSSSNRQQFMMAMETIDYGTEKALNNQTPKDEAHEHLDGTERLAKHIASQNDIGFEMKQEARLFELYTPFYRNRVERLNHTLKQRRILSKGIAKLYEGLMAAPIHTMKLHGNHLDQPNHTPCIGAEFLREAKIPVLGMQMLALRADKVFFPTFRRETRLKGPGGKSRRHEGYFYENQTKYPVKLASSGEKTSEKAAHDGTILRLSLDEVIQGAFKACGKEVSLEKARESVPQLTALLYAEIVGQELSPDLRKFLNAATDGLRDILNTFTSAYKKNVLLSQTDLGDDAKVAWTVYAQGSQQWNDFLRGRTYGKGGNRVDLARIEKLDQLLTEWGDGYFSVANLKKTGEFDYIVAVLRETIGGLAIAHAVAENPGVCNAMFVFRGETGVVDGRIVRTWHDVFHGPSQMLKQQVESLGAHRIVHTVNADTNLLEYLTRPHTT